MPGSLTPNLSIPLMAFNDPTWNVKINAIFSMLDGLGALGALAVATKESPSTSLNVKVSAGTWRLANGTTGSYAGTGSQACTTSATNYLWLTDAGVLTLSTSAFPTSGNFIPLAVVVAGASTITSITDARSPWQGRGGHIGFGVGTPTIAAGAGAGASPTLAISGSDQAGAITVTTGTSPSASAVVATITFGMVFGSTPRMVAIQPGGVNAAALTGTGAVWADSGGLSTTAFTLNVGSSALAGATAYKFWYQVIG